MDLTKQNWKTHETGLGEQFTTEMPNKTRAFGNAEIVAMLERWLVRAKEGRLNYMALVAIEMGKTAYMDYMGSVDVEEQVPWAVDQLKQLIENIIKARMPPPQNYDLDASYVCYNCCKQALAFDFLVWLPGAEMERRREGAPGPLKVGFWAGVSGTQGLYVNYRVKMFDGVVKPAVPLIGAVEDPMACYGRTRGYRLREIVEGFGKGEEIPKYKPSNRARSLIDSWFTHDERPITITLREQDVYWEHRNSNLEAWLRFGKYLEDRGEMVIFVRDNAKADERLPDASTCPDASKFLDVRCALYERAKCNLLVSNGPASLLLFMDAPWLMLSQHNPNSEYMPETPEWWARNGMEPGQYPWLKPHQREVFSMDDFDSIMSAWKEYRGAL